VTALPFAAMRLAPWGLLSILSAVVACGSSSPNSGFTNPGGADSGSGSGGGSGSSSGGGSGGSSGSSSGGGLLGDGGTTSPGQDGSTTTPVALVYAHSPDTLYRLDPMSDQIAVVGPFSGGCDQVIDIAIDSSSNAYVTTETDLWKVSLTSAACTHVASGSYPNSLSFVPKGTVDPNAEALVGYLGGTYIRIDTTSGAVTTIGPLSNDGYSSSGDIVSVIGGGTFLTVQGGPDNCGDCLLQVNPKTGAMIQDYGSVAHSSVFGLAFWAGTAYGFDDGGDVFSITWTGGKLVTTPIAVPNPPSGLEFWGAGSTTAAPPTAADGGGIPIQ
jgi:hypothetical protein